MASRQCAMEAAPPTRHKTRYVRSRKKKVKSGRSCRSCGKDPSPNYFYCPSCHHKVSGFVDGEGL